MKIKSKKGQTEDIFADLVISLILIAVTIAAIKWGEGSMKDSITLKQTREISSQHAIDMLSLMRMPLTEAELAGWNMYEEMTFGEIFCNNLRRKQGALSLGILSTGRQPPRKQL